MLLIIKRGTFDETNIQRMPENFMDFHIFLKYNLASPCFYNN